MYLYFRQGCGYCMDVIDAARRMGVRLMLKDIADPHVAWELAEHGGKWQVPYLVDDSAGVALYESEAIIAYLQKKQGIAAT